MPSSSIAQALSEYWAAATRGKPLPELPGDPVDAFIELIDRASEEPEAFHLLDAGADPYPGLALGDASHPHRIVWALQVAELEPFACDALPEITFYLDTLADPSGHHRVYSHEEGAPGPYEFADLAPALRFMAAKLRHARGELADDRFESIVAECSVVLEDAHEESGASGFFVFENVLSAPLPEAWEALSRGEWPEIELMGKPTRVNKSVPSWQRELSLRALGLFLRDRRVILPEEVALRELRAAHRALFEHLQMLEESFSLGLVPELVETLAADGEGELSELAQAWMRRFDEAHGMPEGMPDFDDEPLLPKPEKRAKAAGKKSGEDAEFPPEAIDRLAALLRGELGAGARGEEREPEDEDEDELGFQDEDTEDEPPQEELTPFMQSMRAAAREAIATLVSEELIEIDENERDALALDMANAAADARSAKQMLDAMTRALVDSARVEEVYASDDEIERCLKRLMGG